LKQDILQIDERAIITYINGSRELKAFLLYNGITVGTVIYKNYSPAFSALISITVNGKMLSFRKADFDKIDWVKI